MTALDHVLVWVYMAFVIAPLIMMVLYVVGIQYEAGGICLALVPVVLIALALDVLLNYVPLAVYTWDWKHWRFESEYTFSQRMPRLIDEGGQLTAALLVLKDALDVLCPSQLHIPLRKREAATPA